MTSAEALRLAHDLALAGRYFITLHARERMVQRGVRVADVKHGLVTASHCRPQDSGRWLFETSDTAGDDLALVVALEGHVIVVTVY